MTPLRQRMLDDMQLKGFSGSTQKLYLRAVRLLAEHYRKSPDRISEEELRQYFLYVKNVKKWSRSASTIALCGIKFFYTHTLKRDWTTLRFVRPPKEKKLPVVLTVAEVKRILSHVRLLRHRVCLFTIYSAGLRLSEGTHLQVPDIDSARMLIHIRHGKGAKDRYVPLSETTLTLLRQFWKTHRNPLWLFPGPGRNGRGMATADKPVSHNVVQDAFRDALRQSGINKRAQVHTLRHSFATHLLEAGVNLRLIQDYLGHNSPKTTALYTHLTRIAQEAATKTLNQLMDQFSRQGDHRHGGNR